MDEIKEIVNKLKIDLTDCAKYGYEVEDLDYHLKLVNKLDELIKINFIDSSLQLKGKHKISFEDWLIEFFIQKDECNYIDKETDELFDKEDLYVKYLWLKDSL